MIQESLSGSVAGNTSAGNTFSPPHRMLVDRYRERKLYFVTKRVFDVIAATLGLIVLSPVMLLIALLIKLDSPGSVFFVQKRVGTRQRHSQPMGNAWHVSTFPFIKFRSMTTGADENAHRDYVRQWAKGQASANTTDGQPKFKMQNDSRITRVGRIIRKTSLDELPQLFNVIRGDMSLVGPRPVPIYEAELYQGEQWDRLCVPPGLTGLWQVVGRGDVSFEEMLRLDLEYVRRRSWRLDLWILFKTLPAVLSGRGAK
jgi:lipopolysaccharide/colanic/teichoic acid biosynthesis glycosyltransferase